MIGTYKLQIVKILYEDAHVAGQNSLHYIKEKLLDYNRNERARQNNKQFNTEQIKKQFDNDVKYVMDELLKSKMISEHKDIAYVSENGQSSIIELINYNITRKGKAAWVDVQLHGYLGGNDIYALNEALHYMGMYGENNLQNMAEILKQLQINMNVSNIKRILLFNSLVKDMGSDIVIFTKKGRKLKRLGSFEKYLDYRKKKRKEKEEAKELNLNLIRSNLATAEIQKNQKSINWWIAGSSVAATFFSFLAILLNRGNDLNLNPINFFTGIVIFIFGLIGGMVIYLLLKEIKSKQP